jgi:hypothetical protein
VKRWGLGECEDQVTEGLSCVIVSNNNNINNSNNIPISITIIPITIITATKTTTIQHYNDNNKRIITIEKITITQQQQKK